MADLSLDRPPGIFIEENVQHGFQPCGRNIERADH
jgi:hypothetical protein